MIREEVEKLRGLVLTPEELEDVIMPLVVASKKRKNKPEHDCSVTKELLKQSYYKYYNWCDNCKRGATLYGILRDMAKDDQNNLLYLWDKILETGKLVCPKDINEELLLAFDVGSKIEVYGDYYEVSSIDGKAGNVVNFRKL